MIKGLVSLVLEGDDEGDKIRFMNDLGIDISIVARPEGGENWIYWYWEACQSKRL